jgi:8-oxo-dGTP pyrophosphatase MutT (NUDIX family)
MTEVLQPTFTTDSERRGATAAIRPRDAATLVLVDRDGGTPRILMGRRKQSLRFMPGLTVFPGGRVDPSDRRMARVGGFPDNAVAKFLTRCPGATPKRIEALALAAIRETYEEAGVLLGIRAAPPRVPGPDWDAFARHGVTPDLSKLVYAVRAITPPGRPRRFDTRFFLADASAVAVTLDASERPDTDLEAVEWLTIAEARERPLAFITGVILGDIEKRLARDDWASADLPVPFYFSRRDQHLRDEI